MDWNQIAPFVVAFLQNAITSWHTPTAPVPAPAPAPSAGPDQFIRDLQALLNTLNTMGLISLPAPLAVDGWLGDKTRAAGEQAIAKIKALAGIK